MGVAEDGRRITMLLSRTWIDLAGGRSVGSHVRSTILVMPSIRVEEDAGQVELRVGRWQEC